jgi:hypothetical protein
MKMLEREGALSAWSDRDINAGSEIDAAIANAHNDSLLFIPIVSPDFLASNYCYDQEMKTAFNRAASGEMTIVPIIAEPCDWLSSPLAKFKAAPKDGKPISEWANENNAYVDIVRELRRIINNQPRFPDSAERIPLSRPTLRIKKDFTSIDRDQFRDDSFSEIQLYFKNSIKEIGEINEIQSRFEEMSATAFTCTVVNRARSNAESHLTVRNNKGGRNRIGDISCSDSAFDDSTTTSTEIISVKADDYTMFLSLSFGNRFFSGANRDEKLSAAQVADILWIDFIKQAGIEYD